MANPLSSSYKSPAETNDVEDIARGFDESIDAPLDGLNIGEIEGLDFKISKFKIEKNELNSPALDLKIRSNMFNINWDLEIYAYLKNNKLCIIGNDPLLHPDIITIVELARGVHFEKIEIMTSGEVLADEGFTKKLINSGVSSFSLIFRYSPRP